MTRTALILRGLRHYWRRHLGTWLGAMFGAAILVGALTVGDSVDHTLAVQGSHRIGRIALAAGTGDRFFRDDLAERVGRALPVSSIGFAGAKRYEAGAPRPTVAPVLQMQAVASTRAGTRRAIDVQTLGVDERFFDLAPEPGAVSKIPDGAVAINENLAQQLNVALGDEIILRVQKPEAMPIDSALGNPADIMVALRVAVHDIVTDDAFGRFTLHSAQAPPRNAFVSLEWLQDQLEVAGQANLLLVGVNDGTGVPDVGRANDIIDTVWTMEDTGLELRAIPETDDGRTGETPVLPRELRSDRIFIDAPVSDLIERAAGENLPVTVILTYFVNELRAGDRSTPYSMVAAIGSFGDTDALPPSSLGPDEIIINEWLAEDIGLSAGDDLTLRYYEVDARQRLVEAARTFTISDVVPMAGWAADRTLMPDFPGIVEAENSRDWEGEIGVPIDAARIRDKDEAYWDAYRGTPKAFISLEAGREMWANRFGAATAIRVPAEHAEELRRVLEDGLHPEMFGVQFADVRERALRTGIASTDFGGLFLGLSLFLIAASVILTGLFFVFGIEQRGVEIGTLLAVGFRRAHVRWMFLAEGILIAALGALVGALLGLGYTKLVLLGLATIWRDAVAGAEVFFHAAMTSIMIGIAGAISAAVLAMWITLRGQMRRSTVALLRGGTTALRAVTPGSQSRGIVLAVLFFIAALAILMLGLGRSGPASAGIFFAAGATLLISMLLLCRAMIVRIGCMGRPAPPTLPRLALGNLARRRGRSLATIAILGCGVFLIVAVGANRLRIEDPHERASGTGGFELFATSTVPIARDLESPEGGSAFGLSDHDLRGVSIIPMRVREGDEASCLNLNRPQQPRLIAVDPDALRGRFRFANVMDRSELEHAWSLLESRAADESVPAIGDQTSVTWTLHKSVGDTIEYVDEQGRPFRVRIVATLANSILQGSLIISRAEFERRFPSVTGARTFLIDVDPELRDPQEVAAVLMRQLSDVGLEVVPAAERLAAFNAVQNTYLSIFQVLGSLGLLLGSVGLALVVLRNMLERRKELAILRAVGFRRRQIRTLVAAEHSMLLLLGVAGGAVAALLAVLPAVLDRAAAPFLPAVVVVIAVTSAGMIWVILATSIAVRGPLLSALRDE